jgi:cell division protein FtsL
MVPAARAPILFAALAAFPAFAHGTTLAEMTRSCQVEIQKVEARIAAVRTKPEYQSQQARQALSSADRWLHQARKHAVKGESRNCMSAVQKSRAQI